MQATSQEGCRKFSGLTLRQTTCENDRRKEAGRKLIARVSYRCARTHGIRWTKVPGVGSEPAQSYTSGGYRSRCTATLTASACFQVVYIAREGGWRLGHRQAGYRPPEHDCCIIREPRLSNLRLGTRDDLVFAARGRRATKESISRMRRCRSPRLFATIALPRFFFTASIVSYRYFRSCNLLRNPHRMLYKNLINSQKFFDCSS